MVTLTQRAHQRLVVLNALDRGEMVMAAAAALVGLSVRHLWRIRQAYRRSAASAQLGPDRVASARMGH